MTIKKRGSKKTPLRTRGKKKFKLSFAQTGKLQSQIEENIPYSKVVLVSLCLVFVSVLLVLFAQKYLPPEVPLFYGLPKSEEQLAQSTALVIPSFISLAILVLNTTLAYFINDKYIKSLLIFTDLAVVLFSTITTVKIMLLIGSY